MIIYRKRFLFVIFAFLPVCVLVASLAMLFCCWRSSLRISDQGLEVTDNQSKSSPDNMIIDKNQKLAAETGVVNLAMNMDDLEPEYYDTWL